MYSTNKQLIKTLNTYSILLGIFWSMSTKIALKSFMTSRPGMLSGKIRVHIFIVFCFSASLNQLDGDAESYDDDSYPDKEDNLSPNRQNPLDMDALSISPSESGGSSPFGKLRTLNTYNILLGIFWSMSTKIALKSFMTSRPGMLSGKI
jgi:hypothetical protein